MIALRNDYLLFEEGEVSRPCCAETIIERLLDGNDLDPAVRRKVSDSVVIYFREIKGTEKVTVFEFREAMIEALILLGYNVEREYDYTKDDIKDLLA